MKVKQTYLFFKSFITIAIIFAFVLSAVKPLYSFTQLSDQYSELHSAEAEKDACHRKAYHHDDTHECSHDSHIITHDSNSDITKTNKEFYIDFAIKKGTTLIKYANPIYSIKPLFYITALNYTHSLRGPPTIV